MNRTKHLNGVCSHCGRSFAFLAETIGLTAPCPHCGQPTELLLAPPEADTSAPRKLIVWTMAGVMVLAVGIVGPLVGLKIIEKKAAERRANRPAAAADARTNGVSEKP